MAGRGKSKSAALAPGIAMLAGGALVAAALMAPRPAHPEPVNCGPRASVVKALTERFSEAPVAVGLSDSGALVEVLTSDNGATWSILLSQPDGTSCLVAAGESWQPLTPVASIDRRI